MKPQSTLIGLVIAIGLSPVAALAEHERGSDDDDRRPAVEVHVHDSSCHHPGAPQGQPSREGRYELRTVQKWVPGFHEQVWVPQHCKHRGRGHHRVKCVGGYYQQQWRPGYHQTVQDWVWVPSPRSPWRHSGYSLPPPPPQPSWSARASTTHAGTTVDFRVRGGF